MSCDCAKPNTKSEVQSSSKENFKPIRGATSEQMERRFVTTTDQFTSQSTYKSKLQARKQLTKEWNKGFRLDSCNGFYGDRKYHEQNE